MMFRYPYFMARPPFMNYRMYSNGLYSNKKFDPSSKKDISHLEKTSKPTKQKEEKTSSNIAIAENSPRNQKKENPEEDPEILNIFGVSLHTDDILIIGLLIFLYIEEVDDPYLFVCLILLLLS